MAKKNKSEREHIPPKMRPALTPEAREDQCISLAYDLVEERLRNGTATSQETTHFLKLGSERARLEKDILERQCDLLSAKTESLKSAKRVEELYAEAMRKMRRYNGQYDEAEEENDGEWEY